jgi:hypothetical protein
MVYQGRIATFVDKLPGGAAVSRAREVCQFISDATLTGTGGGKTAPCPPGSTTE